MGWLDGGLGLLPCEKAMGAFKGLFRAEIGQNIRGGGCGGVG